MVGTTVIQNVSGFIDTSSIQYFLSSCSSEELCRIYSYSGSDIYTYVFGIFAAVLDFKNLVPSIVMVLGITAVPAISTAYESSNSRFSALLTGIFKYSSIPSIAGGLLLALLSRELLGLFYGGSNEDIVKNGGELLFYMGISVLSCAVATTTVYTVQALGFAKSAIPAFIVSGVIRVILNFALITDDSINIKGAVISNCAGFAVIVVMNFVTIRKKTNAKISFF